MTLTSRWIRFSAVTVLGFLGLATQSAQAFDLSVLAGASGTYAVTSPLVATTPVAKPMGGIGLGFGNFELDVMYAPRSYSFATATENETRLALMTYFRLQASVFDFLIGTFGSFGIGDLALSTGATSSYASAGQNPVDYGLAFGLGAGIPVSEKIKLLVRGQYLFGLGNGFTLPLVTLNYRDMQAMAGVRFEF